MSNEVLNCKGLLFSLGVYGKVISIILIIVGVVEVGVGGGGKDGGRKRWF